MEATLKIPISADAPALEVSLADVLAEIAQLASRTLELQDVFDQVADSVRQLIPLDHLKVVRIVGTDRAVVHATTWSVGDNKCPMRVAGCWEPVPLTAFSPRIRPRPTPMAPLADAQAELDPEFPADARILAAGVRSALWEPFQAGERFAGGLLVSSSRPRALTSEHQESLRPIAALLGSAVEHWRMWDAERRRRERLDRMEALLGTLAESLDVREVFERLSAEMQPMLAHDLLGLTELDVRAGTLQVVAKAGEADIQMPVNAIPLTREEHELRADFEIVDDLPARISPDTERGRLLLATGMRSWLRVPVRLAGEIKGSLSFFARQPNAFCRDDAEVASRLADRIALTLSFQRLAEEARVASEARERAARLEATVETLTHELKTRARGRVIGESRAWREVLGQVGRVAASETTVLITGESGTGKEIVARLVHEGSARSRKPFVAVNCAALPEQLLESELFGHEKGAFTGAAASKIGLLEQGAGGTLFLDEIGEMSPLVQAKFLRVLQEREFQRLGGTRALRTDVRVLAATNRDLAAEIKAGRFREDLYYRLNVVNVHLPPLRDRGEDILVIARYLLSRFAPEYGGKVKGFSPNAVIAIRKFPWPGNIRQLENHLKKAVVLADKALLGPDDLGLSPEVLPPILPLQDAKEKFQREYINEVLELNNGNRTKTARDLGVDPRTIFRHLEKEDGEVDGEGGELPPDA